MTTGKAINFIRVVCGESQWVLEHASARSAEALDYSAESSIKQLVADVADKTQKHLLELLFNQYKLVKHLSGVKRYILLGQGDFATHLMDMLGPELSKPSAQIFNHNLTAVLESAVRASNAQFDDSDVLACVDAAVLTKSAGSEGWDVFSLSYIVKPPINILLTPTAMTTYLKIFNFIWRLKRVLKLLTISWREDMALSKWAKAIQEAVPQASGFYRMIHTMYTVRSELHLFMKHLEYFFMFEVLECNWLKFEQYVKEAKDLDQVISAHSQYLTDITNKVFLTTSSSAGSEQAIQGEAAFGILKQIFDNIMRFLRQHDLFLKAQHRAAEVLQRAIRQRELKGSVVQIATILAAPTREQFEGIDNIRKQHNQLVARFYGIARTHPDASLRALVIESSF